MTFTHPPHAAAVARLPLSSIPYGTQPRGQLPPELATLLLLPLLLLGAGAVVVGLAVVGFVPVRLDGALAVEAASVAVDGESASPAVRTAVPAMAPAAPTAVKVRTRCRAFSLADVEPREKPAAGGFSLFFIGPA
jgi:hypothetical protein